MSAGAGRLSSYATCTNVPPVKSIPACRPKVRSNPSAAAVMMPVSAKKTVLWRMMNILCVRPRTEEEAGEAVLCVEAERHEEGAGYGDGGEHGNENAEPEDERETLDEGCPEPKENDGGNHARDIG